MTAPSKVKFIDGDLEKALIARAQFD